MRSNGARASVLLLVLLSGLTAVSAAGCTFLEGLRASPTPTRTPRPTSTPTPSATPTPVWPVSVFAPNALPSAALEELQAAMALDPHLFTAAPSAGEADVRVVVNPVAGTPELASFVYAVVAPFPTLVDEVAWDDVVARWSGDLDGPFTGQPLLVGPETYASLAPLLGPAGDGVSVVSADQLIDEAWAARPSWALVPFDDLEPRWKVLRVDGLSPLDKDLDLAAYPLVVRAGLVGVDHGVTKMQDLMGPPFTNRDRSQMTVVMMTGVTALTRGTAMAMEREGVTYPARDILDWLLEPDITHISNEVSFAENCGAPSGTGSLLFCSAVSYFELLEYIDVDVIELTGNHVLDWGEEAMLLSLQMYDDHGMLYFGGGQDLAQAQQPLTLTQGLHTFAFVGCNPIGPPSDWATADGPGSAPCTGGQLGDELGPLVGQLRDSGALPIVTVQHREEYTYEPTETQQADFRALAEAGAVIVSGSQAHQPQGFEFHAGSFIHYGLGNLFFDQMQALATRQEFVDRHVFYEGRHISTELLTAILEDYSRPRPMTAEEREALLVAAFAASGW